MVSWITEFDCFNFIIETETMSAAFTSKDELRKFVQSSSEISDSFDWLWATRKFAWR